MLRLGFYRNSKGIWVGDLHADQARLLATTHPATIAAAIFAMDEHSLMLETELGRFEMQFPFDQCEYDPIGEIIQDGQMAQWMESVLHFLAI